MESRATLAASVRFGPPCVAKSLDKHVDKDCKVESPPTNTWRVWKDACKT